MKDHFGTILIISAVIAVGFLVLRTLFRATLDATAKSTKTTMEALVATRPDFVAHHTAFSITAKSMIAVDENTMKVLLYFVEGTDIKVRELSIPFILSTHLDVDGNVHTTGLTSGLVGDQSIVAATNYFSSQSVNTITLRFFLNLTQLPFVDHVFLTNAAHGKFEASSDYVKTAMADAMRIKAVVDVLLLRT